MITSWGGGGCLIAIKNNISCIRMKEWEEEIPFDNIWLRINSKNGNKLLVNCIYIKPSTNFDTYNLYLKQLQDIINIREPDAHILILGDFNLSCIDWYFEPNRSYALNIEGRLSQELISTLTITDLKQVNCIRNHQNRILDLILTNTNPIEVTKTSGIVNEDPYHPALLIHIDQSFVKFMRSKKSPKHNFFKADYDSINHVINGTDWNTLFANIDIDSAVNNFYSTIREIIDAFTPKIIPTSEDYPKWFSPKLIQLIKEKEYYHKRKKNSNTNAIFNELFVQKRKQIKNEKKNVY